MLKLDDERKSTVNSIKPVTDYANYNLFQMDIRYEYNLIQIINEISTYNHSEHPILNDQIVSAAIFREAMGIPGKIDFHSFGCTAFKMVDNNTVRMGRNYDFKNDTSCMLVKCHPKGMHSSVAFAALDNIHANHLDNNYEKYACLAAPFICLDGINSAGVSIAVLTLDSEPVFEHDDNKSTIATTLAIRAVLDEADSADHAVRILERYNMYATGGRDYHFFILDADGNCRVVEYIYDDESGKRTFKSTYEVKSYGHKEELQCATNFFINYIDKVAPGKKNGIYGHGKDRYNAVLDIIDKHNNNCGNDEVWEALKASAQLPGDDATSNTQWSVVYENISALNPFSDFNATAQIALKRDFRNKWSYDSLKGIRKL